MHKFVLLDDKKKVCLKQTRKEYAINAKAHHETTHIYRILLNNNEYTYTLQYKPQMNLSRASDIVTDRQLGILPLILPASLEYNTIPIILSIN